MKVFLTLQQSWTSQCIVRDKSYCSVFHAFLATLQSEYCTVFSSRSRKIFDFLGQKGMHFPALFKTIILWISYRQYDLHKLSWFPFNFFSLLPFRLCHVYPPTCLQCLQLFLKWWDAYCSTPATSPNPAICHCGQCPWAKSEKKSRQGKTRGKTAMRMYI